jgi:sulfite reductase (NADPH) hemoprotein beta-component
VADVIGFLPPDKVEVVAKAVLTIHRDFGDRADRKHARLKYVIADRGATWFREELEQRVGFKLEDSRPFKFTSQGDPFGWHRQADAKLFLGLFMETGRITDRPLWRMKSAMRAVVERFQTEVRLTPANNAILVNIRPEDRAAITAIFAAHGIDPEKQGSVLRRSSMACVSLPTCGLALAESERYLPDLVTRLESALSEAGLANEEINIRMTGCPNGCARPYLAEIGFVGKAPGRYQIWLGGNHLSTRLNRLYRDNVKEAEIVAELKPLFDRFAGERLPGEGFGDFSHRVVLSQPIPSAA